MRKPFLFASLMCVLTLTSALTLAANGTLPGTGTEANPYLIEDLADFDAFANPANAATYWAAGVHTQLTTDIDLSGKTVLPIGNNSTEFRGVFNGNRHVISNLTIYQLGNEYVGLFGYLRSDGQILDIGVENVDITGGRYVGGLVGSVYRNGKTISNCYTTGEVTGYDFVGGLVGDNVDGAYISDCYSTATVTGGSRVGGLVGQDYGTTFNCYSTGDVSGEFEVGGLIGRKSSDIIDCYATGTVTGSGDSIGGLVGYFWGFYGPISNSYATGSVTGENEVGGLVGYAMQGAISRCFASGSVASAQERTGGLVGVNRSTIINSYATGSVTGDEGYCGGLVGYNYETISNSYSSGAVNSWNYTGGFVGWNNDTISNCFWDIETSGMSEGVGNETPDPSSVIGKTTIEMKSKSIYSGWDFQDVWDVIESQTYPFLPPYPKGDLNRDGTVNILDFSIFAEDWLK